MKRRITVLTALIFVVAFIFSTVACTDISATAGDNIVIEVTGEIEEGTTLEEYMQSIKGGDLLKTYTVSNGMITEINSIKPSVTSNMYWMLYTNDPENSNSDWGTVEVNGTTYYSATLGAETLVVKSGYTYVWYIVQF